MRPTSGNDQQCSGSGRRGRSPDLPLAVSPLGGGGFTTVGGMARSSGSGRELALLVLLAGMAISADWQRPKPLSWLATKGVEAVDIDEVVAGVDIDAIVQRIDINALVADIDIDAVLQRIDITALLEQVDLDAVLRRVDMNALLATLDVNALVARIDLDTVLEGVDANALLDRVDPNRLLDRVDPNPLLDRVEPNPLLDRVDADRLLDRVDVDRLMDRVDVPGIVERAGIAEIVAESTGAVAGSVLDIARRQLVALDQVVERPIYRLTRQDPATRPPGPERLAARPTALHGGRLEVTGRYAGPVTRVLAFALDGLITFWAFTLGTASLAWLGSSFGITIPSSLQHPAFGFIALATWYFLYWWIGLGLTGRTIGKGVLGLRVLQNDGDPITAKEAAVRTAVMPLSFLTLTFGVIVVLISPRRRTLHDFAAGTCEVYDWGDRPAELPAPLSAWIARRYDDIDESEPPAKRGQRARATDPPDPRDQPAQPAQPDPPDHPAQPAQPDQPAQPAQPDPPDPRDQPDQPRGAQ